MATILTAPAQPIHHIARTVGRALRSMDASLESAADQICRRVMRIEPEPAPARVLNDPRPEASLDAHIQRAYRHDTTWAIPEMWWEMALGGIGAATFTAATLSGNTAGMAAGWTLGAGGKGVLLLLDLGRPERVWQVFAKPTTSWIARGSYAFATFATAGAAAIGLRLLDAKAAAAAPAAAAVAASTIVASYDGYFLNRSAAVSGWESPYLPALFAANAAVAGASIAGACAPRPTPWLAAVTVAGAAASAGIAQLHLDQLANGDAAAQLTRDELTTGVEQPDFILGAAALGTLAPALLAVIGASTRSRTAWCLAASLSSLGVLLGRKAILKSGIHSPVI